MENETIENNGTEDNNIEIQKVRKKNYLLPASVLVVAILISISIVYSVGKKSNSNNNIVVEQNETSALQQTNDRLPKIRPIDSEDHILGNPNAKIKVVEYADLECPFCKEFHNTMKEIMGIYGDKIALVYRHFPLIALHPKARNEAEAAECAGGLGGEKGFWSYVNRVFEVTPSNNKLDAVQLSKIAEYVGLDKSDFEKCVSEKRFSGRIERDIKEGNDIGIRGTPYSVVFVDNIETFVIPGAYPIETMKIIFDELLNR